MAHRFPNILIHFVFSTASRQDLIPRDLHQKLWAYLNGIGKNHNMPVLAAGGTTNHVHILVTLPPDMAPYKAVQVFKANSSRWLGKHGIEFAWQEGYGAFSVSASMRDIIVRYIESQAEHHKKRSYDDEFLTMLRKIGLTDVQDALG